MLIVLPGRYAPPPGLVSNVHLGRHPTPPCRGHAASYGHALSFGELDAASDRFAGGSRRAPEFLEPPHACADTEALRSAFFLRFRRRPPVKFSQDPSAIRRGAGEYAFLAGRLPSDGTDGADTQPL